MTRQFATMKRRFYADGSEAPGELVPAPASDTPKTEDPKLDALLASMNDKLKAYMKGAPEAVFLAYADANEVVPDELAKALGRPVTETVKARSYAPLARRLSAKPAASVAPGSLRGRDLEQLQKGMGTFKASTPRVPYKNSNGDLVLPTLTPTEHRARIAAEAAKAGAK